GPLLPAERVPDRPAASSGTDRGYSAARPALRRASRPERRPAHRRDLPRRNRHAGALPVARERPRAAARPPPGGDPVARREPRAAAAGGEGGTAAGAAGRSPRRPPPGAPRPGAAADGPDGS